MTFQMKHETFRTEPLMAVTAYKTYAVSMPAQTHTRVVDCETYGCAAHHQGWKTVLDLTQAAHRDAATWIVNDSLRHHTMERAENIVTFLFPPGQACFAEHRVAIRPANYLVRDGDWRGNPTGRKVAMGQQQWVDDFGEHQEKLAEAQKRG